MIRRPPRSTLFPSPPLFRSVVSGLGGWATGGGGCHFLRRPANRGDDRRQATRFGDNAHPHQTRSEEHTSELQSLAYLVCRLLLEKKKQTKIVQRPNATRSRK